MNLSNNSISDKNIISFTESLKKLQNLTNLVLKLENNKLTNVGLNQLFHSFKFMNLKILTINISKNNIDKNQLSELNKSNDYEFFLKKSIIY